MWLVAFQRVSLSQGLDPGFRASKSIPDMHPPPRDCQKELESLWVGKWHLSWWQALILLNAMSMWPHTSESHIQQRKGIIPPRKIQLTAPYESEEVRPIWIPFVESLYENYEIWLGRLAEIKIQTNKNIFKTNSEGKNNSTKGLTLPLRSLLAMSSFLKLHSLERQHWVGQCWKTVWAQNQPRIISVVHSLLESDTWRLLKFQKENKTVHFGLFWISSNLCEHLSISFGMF